MGCILTPRQCRNNLWVRDARYERLWFPPSTHIKYRPNCARNRVLYHCAQHVLCRLPFLARRSLRPSAGNRHHHQQQNYHHEHKIILRSSTRRIQHGTATYLRWVDRRQKQRPQVLSMGRGAAIKIPENAGQWRAKKGYGDVLYRSSGARMCHRRRAKPVRRRRTLSFGTRSRGTLSRRTHQEANDF